MVTHECEFGVVNRAAHVALGRRSPHRLGNRMNEPMGQAPAPLVPATRFVNEAPTAPARAALSPLTLSRAVRPQ